MRCTAALTLITSLLLGALSARSGNDAFCSPLRVMEWNVENLFDTLDDDGFRDEEFLPQGERQWTSHRYWRKLTDIAKVIAAISDEGGTPDLIGLCEVENDSVLTTLTQRSALRHLGYSYVMTHSDDERGIDVALLYQPVHFKLVEYQDIPVPSREKGLRPTRNILYAKGLVLAGDSVETLHVFVVHLPSRAGGHPGDKNRRLAARTLWDAIGKLPQDAKILVMGDFNATGRDRIFKHSPLMMTDDPHSPGTYCFQGFWQWIDHILVSSSVVTKGYACPVRQSWLLEENKTYGDDMPRRAFRGPVYHGGISDHLPLVLDLSF